MFGKKKASVEDLVTTMLDLPRSSYQEVANRFKDAFNYSGNVAMLEFEVLVFYLWVVIASLPPLYHPYRQLIIKKFCERFEDDSEKRKVLYDEINERYSNYFEAFYMWLNNPRSGGTLGSVIVETVINQNRNCSPKKHLPMVGATEALLASTIFITEYKRTLNTLGKIEKKFKIVS